MFDMDLKISVDIQPVLIKSFTSSFAQHAYFQAPSCPPVYSVCLMSCCGLIFFGFGTSASEGLVEWIFTSLAAEYVDREGIQRCQLLPYRLFAITLL